MTRSKDVNQMCLNCKNTSCDGTTSKVWTGCLFKDKDYMLVYNLQAKKVTIVGKK